MKKISKIKLKTFYKKTSLIFILTTWIFIAKKIGFFIANFADSGMTSHAFTISG